MYKRTLLSLLSLLFLLSACGPAERPRWDIARDPTWFPNQFPGMEVKVTAFSDQLVEAIAQEGGMRIGIYPISWSFLQGDLIEGRVDGVLANLPPVAENLELYDFSKVYLYTGSVLVVPADSPIRDLQDLNGREVGAARGSADILILAPLADVLITHYTNFREALLGVWRGEVEAVLIPALIAYAYCANLYAGQLKVVTPPLTDDGLRLIVRKGKSKKLLEKFNKGLEQEVLSGGYNRLQEKWGLDLGVGPLSPIMLPTK